MKTAQPFDLIPVQRQLLAAQDFEQRAPGTILRDFEALLSLIGDAGLPVTPAHLFAMSSLETINRRLAQPLELRLKRASQKSYPPINGLYLVLRATGLGQIDPSLKPARIQLDPFVLASWRSLNATERYFALLRAWWGRASAEMIGERRGGWGDAVLQSLLRFFNRFPKTGSLTLPTPQDADRFRYDPGFYNLALLDLFGLFDLRLRPPAEGQGWLPERLRLTEWGQALLGSYADFLGQSPAPEAESALSLLGFAALGDPWAGFEAWARRIRPQLPAWQTDLELPVPVFQPGPHLFKVTLGAACWRRIAIPGDAHLDQLAAAILGAFNFDHDHLYCFSYRDRFGRTVDIDHPYLAGDSEHALADAVKIGDLLLAPGMRLDFLFDFGDQWHFTLHTESIDAGPAIHKPRVLEKHGKAPKQYGGW
jgi:hypothetical protein